MHHDERAVGGEHPQRAREGARSIEGGAFAAPEIEELETIAVEAVGQTQVGDPTRRHAHGERAACHRGARGPAAVEDKGEDAELRPRAGVADAGLLVVGACGPRNPAHEQPLAEGIREVGHLARIGLELLGEEGGLTLRDGVVGIVLRAPLGVVEHPMGDRQGSRSLGRGDVARRSHAVDGTGGTRPQDDDVDGFAVHARFREVDGR